MRTAEIEKLIEPGTHVAVGTGTGNQYLGQHYGVSRARVIAVRQERTKSGYWGYNRLAHDGVLIELLADDGAAGALKNEQTVMPKDVLGTWERHIEVQREDAERAKYREAARDAERQRFAVAIERLEDVLGHPLPRDNTGVDGFTVDARWQRLKVRDARPIEWLADAIEHAKESYGDQRAEEIARSADL